MLPDAGDNDLVLFEVTLERLTSRVVFTLEPGHRVPGPEPSNLQLDRATDEYRRPGMRRNSTFAYQMLTTGLKGGQQVQFRRQMQPYDARQKTELLEPFASLHVPEKKPGNPNDLRRQGIEDQRKQLEGLAREARDVLQRADLDARRNPREAALALQRYLHHEGNFSYSLNPPPRPLSRAAGDPVNDFVVAGKEGHCEYFASALALMLRSVGIPSRLVLGYKGGEWNAVGGYYEVRQFEAHAWVEAWIFQAEQPLGWLRLDPTPGERVPVVPESPRWKQVRNYVEYLWSRYVLGMDANLQEELVRPLAALLRLETWQNVLNWLVTSVAGDGWPSQESFNWQAGLVVVSLQLLLVALFLSLRRLIGWVRGRRRRAALRRRGIPYVEFYVPPGTAAGAVRLVPRRDTNPGRVCHGLGRRAGRQSLDDGRGAVGVADCPGLLPRAVWRPAVDRSGIPIAGRRPDAIGSDRLAGQPEGVRGGQEDAGLRRGSCVCARRPKQSENGAPPRALRSRSSVCVTISEHTGTTLNCEDRCCHGVYGHVVSSGAPPVDGYRACRNAISSANTKHDSRRVTASGRMTAVDRDRGGGTALGPV